MARSDAIDNDPLICTFAMQHSEGEEGSEDLDAVRLFIPIRQGRGQVSDIRLFYVPDNTMANSLSTEVPQSIAGVVIQFRGQDDQLEQLGEPHEPLPLSIVQALQGRGVLLCFMDANGAIESHQLLSSS